MAHLDFSSTNDLHRELRPLALGFSFGDVSGVFYHTEASLAKIMSEDQIVKPGRFVYNAKVLVKRSTPQTSSARVDGVWRIGLQALVI